MANKSLPRDILGLGLAQPIPHKEILALFATWRDDGDEAAGERIISSNVRFVVQIAHEYVDTCPMNLEELVSEGIIGLYNAREKFDPERGFRFISYAVYWVRCRIRDAISQGNRVVRIPGNIITDRYKITKKRWELANKKGRIPTNSEVYAALGFSNEKGGVLDAADRLAVRADHCRGTSDARPNAPSASPDFDSSWGSKFIVDQSPSPADRVEVMGQRRAISGALRRRLDPRSRYIIRRHFGLLRNPDGGVEGRESVTMSDIGIKLGISRERVRQIKDKAFEKLAGDGDLKRAFAELN